MSGGPDPGDLSEAEADALALALEADYAASQVVPEVVPVAASVPSASRAGPPAVVPPDEPYRIYVAGALADARNPGPSGVAMVITRGEQRAVRARPTGILTAHAAVAEACLGAVQMMAGRVTPALIHVNVAALAKALTARPKVVRVQATLPGVAVVAAGAALASPWEERIVALRAALRAQPTLGVRCLPNALGHPEMVVARSAAAEAARECVRTLGTRRRDR